MDDFEAGTSADLRPRRDPYATKLAIRIMALHCAGKSNSAIHRELKCGKDYVNRTVSYWKTERGEKLAIIKTITRVKIKRSH